MLKAEAISYFGSAQKVASVLGLKSRQAVYQWPGPEVPDRHQHRLHYESQGKLPLSPRLQGQQ